MMKNMKFIAMILVFALILALVPAFTVPALAMGDTGATISAGYDYSMAVKSDGSLWAWGMIPDSNWSFSSDTLLNQPIKITDSAVSVMRALDVGVTWDGATSTIGIDTSMPYTD